MRGFKVAEILVVKNLVKHAIGVPWGAAADEFAISCSKRIEDGVIELLVIAYKVKFIRIHHIKRGASDGFRVVGEGFDAASVGKVDLGSLRLKNNACRKIMRKLLCVL
jgi:hypothetical protein